jgi:hypothetical protein
MQEKSENAVEKLFLCSQENYSEAQKRVEEESKVFHRVEKFRMDKFGVYSLRVLPAAPNRDGVIERKSYEYPLYQLTMELEKPAGDTRQPVMYVSVPRTTDAGYSIDLIDTYRKLAVETAQAQGNTKLAEKIGGASFGGGLKFNYVHSLYVFDRNERAHGSGFPHPENYHPLFALSGRSKL